MAQENALERMARVRPKQPPGAVLALEPPRSTALIPAPNRGVMPASAGRPAAAPASTALAPVGQPRGFTAPYGASLDPKTIYQPNNTSPPGRGLAVTTDAGRATQIMSTPANPSFANGVSPQAAAYQAARTAPPAPPPPATPGRAAQALGRANTGWQSFTGGQQGAKGFLAGAGRLAGKLATPLAVGMESLDVARVAADPNASGLDVASQAAQGAGRLGAAGVGAAAGAAMGSVVPVVGTVLGGLAGGALGYFGADKAIEAGRSMAGSDTAAPASRAPDLVQSPATAQAAPQPAKPATQAVANPFAGATTPTQLAPAAAALVAAPVTDPNAPTGNVTRVGNSYSGGNVQGDITINGQAPRNGGMISAQNQRAFDNLQPLYPTPGEAPRGFTPAETNPGLSIMGDTGGYGLRDKGYLERRNAAVPLGSITSTKAQRTEAAAQLARFDQRDLNNADNASAIKRQGMADETSRYGQELSNDTARRGQDVTAAGQMASGAIAQYRAGLEGQELDMKRTAAGFGNRAAARIESLQAAYEAATPEDRPTIAEQLRVMTGKDTPAEWKAIALQGGMDANGNKTEGVLATVNERTGEARRIDGGQQTKDIATDPRALAIKNNTGLSMTEKQQQLKALGYQ